MAIYLIGLDNTIEKINVRVTSRTFTLDTRPGYTAVLSSLRYKGCKIVRSIVFSDKAIIIMDVPYIMENIVPHGKEHIVLFSRSV